MPTVPREEKNIVHQAVRAMELELHTLYNINDIYIYIFIIYIFVIHWVVSSLDSEGTSINW